MALYPLNRQWGTETERGRNETVISATVGPRKTDSRRVGASFKNNRAIPKSTFRLTKHTRAVGEVGTDRERRQGRAGGDVRLANTYSRVRGPAPSIMSESVAWAIVSG